MDHAYLPREVIKWLDQLDLAYAIRNVRRDLANGFVLAEIFSRYFPSIFDIYSFANQSSRSAKVSNWERINECLKNQYIVQKYGEFPITKIEYEPIIEVAPDSAYQMILRVYEFLTRRKLNEAQKLTYSQRRNNINEFIPNYMKMTSAMLAKDRELTRLENNDNRKMKTKQIIEIHQDISRKERSDSNLVEYMMFKRRKKLEEELKIQAEEIVSKQKETSVLLQQNEIKEIPIKSFNAQSNKRKEINKFQNKLEQIVEGREIIESINKMCSEVVDSDPLKKELAEFKIDDKQSKAEIVLQNVKDFSKQGCKQILNVLKENIVVLTEQLYNNYGDFKRFFSMLLIALQNLHYHSKPFYILCAFFKDIGLSLSNQDPFSTQLLFEQIILEKLVSIIKINSLKREHLIELLFSFGHNDTLSKLRIIKKIKEYLMSDLQTFIAILANIVHLACEPEMDEDFYHLLMYYAMISIEFTSPIARANGLRVICEISKINYQSILNQNLMIKFEKILYDEWWESKAQMLILFSNLLLFLNQENPQEIIEAQKEQFRLEKQKFEQDNDQEQIDDLNINNQQILENLQEEKQTNQKNLLHFLYEIFKPYQSENILRVGLIYLAPVTIYYEELCDRYLEILLNVTDPIRECVLTTNPIPGTEEGNIVKGCNTFKYKLTSAPHYWNSVGIAKSLEQHVQKNNLQNFEKEHLEIFVGTMVNPLDEKYAQEWLQIYENLKKHIFLSLSDRDLCSFASIILKKLFIFEVIQPEILNVYYLFTFLTFSKDFKKNFSQNIEHYLSY